MTGKTFPAFPAHAHPQFCVSGKRPIVVRECPSVGILKIAMEGAAQYFTFDIICFKGPHTHVPVRHSVLSYLWQYLLFQNSCWANMKKCWSRNRFVQLIWIFRLVLNSRLFVTTLIGFRTLKDVCLQVDFVNVWQTEAGYENSHCYLFISFPIRYNENDSAEVMHPQMFSVYMLFCGKEMYESYTYVFWQVGAQLRMV